MLMSAEKFGQSLVPPITKQRIYQLINRGDLELTKKKIDTEHPRNAEWIASRKQSPPPTTPPGRWGTPAANGGKSPGTRGSGPAAPRTGDTPPTGYTDPEDSLAGIDAEEILEHMATLDVRRFKKIDIDKLKNLEGLLKIRVERQHKRRELIERSLVQSVFGKLYMIDSNELRVLGARLAPDVAGLLGVDDAEKVLAVEQRIDGEVLKILAHIQRVLHEALLAWGATDGLSDGNP